MIEFVGETDVEKLIHAKKMVARYKYDSMTGLKGRLDFDKSFERLVDSKFYNNKNFTFALVDINGLKKVNDMHGYLAGDELIKKVAKDLIEAFGEIAEIYRFGGDEFAILCPDISREKAKKIFNKIEQKENFNYGIIESEEFDGEEYNCRSIFNFVNSLLIDAKADFKEEQNRSSNFMFR